MTLEAIILTSISSALMITFAAFYAAFYALYRIRKKNELLIVPAWEVEIKSLKLNTIKFIALLLIIVNGYNSPLYAQDIKEKTVLCQGCHGVSGEGGIGPKLAGQEADKILSDLMGYKNGTKKGPQSSLMSSMVAALKEEDLQEFATFYSGQ
ncbi:MAG: hypothetical protein CMD96_00980 [Gammaproteobacteria bacterium]|jgi:cytochrome c553|nr:hypothetical protein [Gammaproteobacteria bacterium]